MRKRLAVLAILSALACVAGVEAQSFDHSTTAFPLDGSHVGVECERCHVNGVFTGMPTNCEYCHAGMSNIQGSTLSPNHIRSTVRCGECHTPAGWDQVMRVEHAEVVGGCQTCHDSLQAMGKPVDHVATTLDCDSCHMTDTWMSARFDHSGITGACSMCHNGAQATGKPPDHISTTLDCDSCHWTDAWIPAGFDHSGVTGLCSNCHNGVQATGKPPDHIATAEDCASCHGTDAWTPAAFDHSGITGPCGDCHNGVQATGKSTGHITTTADCGDCHSVVAWTPAAFDHSNITSPCSSCHNGTGATGKNAGHFVTSLECDACHSTTGWTPAVYMHTGTYPGDHRQQLSCTDCHTSNAEIVPYPQPAYQPDCAACHAGEYQASHHNKAPGINYNVSELRDCAGACHTYTDSTFTTINKTRNGEHRVSDEHF